MNDKISQLQSRVLNLNDRVLSLEKELSRTQERVQKDISKLVTLIDEVRNDPNNPNKTFRG
jgi:predicted nuclease with TOPRIM domain